MRRWMLLALIVGALSVGSAGTARADHDHNLMTPGTTVVVIGDGQSEKSACAPGGHQFHDHMHFGTPGTTAFENPRNPVSVVRTEPPTPC
jgi:hypothetical protein